MDDRARVHTQEKVGGMIILAPSTSCILDDEYYNLMVQLVKIFDIDSLLVIDNQRLKTKLQQDQNIPSSTGIVYIEKLPGAIEKMDRKLLQQKAMKDYFQPHLTNKQTIKGISVCSILPNQLNVSTLPLFQEQKSKMGTVQQMPISCFSENSLAAVVTKNSVVGYACINRIDCETLDVLCPQAVSKDEHELVISTGISFTK